jgi:hypothetical protein
MGAQLWHHEAPWYPNPADALRALQAQFLAENYNLPLLLPQHLQMARNTVAATKADGDEYGLLNLYEEQVRVLEDLNNRPIPQDPQAQIEILRKIHEDTGQGISNVLDVREVSQERDVFTAQRLSEAEIVRLVGTAGPTLAQAQNSVYKINEELGRGECVCFPVYEKDEPMGWYFVGNTAD